MAKNNKTCTICGAEYNYCPKCEKLGGYKFYADTPECFQIFMILYDIREGTVSTAEAKNQFANIGITSDYDFAKFIPSVAELVKSIVMDDTVSPTEEDTVKPKTRVKNKK